MTLTEPRKRPGFATGLWLGLVVGVVSGLLVAEGARLLRSDRWVDVVGEWHRLPGQALADALPQTFSVPAKPWDYGATTRALPPAVTAAPAIVRVDVSDVSGPVGLSLAKPDGSAVISKEKALAVGAAPVSIYFRSSGSQPIAVLVRNYDGKGPTGSVTVRTIKFVPEARLSKRALEKIVAAGLN